MTYLYILKGYPDLMKQYDDTIAKCVIFLLKSCPSEAVSTRKELLIATRQLLATEFRGKFFPYFDRFVDEKVLLGYDKQSHVTLRPLAYSTVADLVHQLRDKLSIQQISKVILLFSKNVHDAHLTVSIQTTSVRLLINLADRLYHSVRYLIYSRYLEISIEC